MSTRPTVLIVGAGLGGLTLGVLLERAGIPYEIFERAAVVKPLGSALSLGTSVIPLFKQIGIYDEFVNQAIVRYTTQVYNEKREIDFVLDSKPGAEMGGHDGYIISRPVIYDILRKQIPSHKIHMSKRVLQIRQNEDEVMILCADNSMYFGHIIVGADGAYSGVRQSMYKEMMADKRLPKLDQQDLPYSCTCLVGQTRPLDPEKFPELKVPECSFDCVLSEDKPYTWVTFTAKNNIICWMVVHHLNKVSSKYNDSFRNSEWGPEAAESMCKAVRDFPIPGGDGQLTLGHLIDNTDKDLISKVTLEEKVFKTWHDRRLVLMGDACHKMNPSGGQGAGNALQDAITLANWINVLQSNDVKEISKIFEEYRAERYPHAVAAFESSKMFSRIIAKDFSGALVRFTTRRMPKWLWMIALRKMASNRPQVAFLPLVEDKGTVKPTYQPSLYKTRKIAVVPRPADRQSANSTHSSSTHSNISSPHSRHHDSVASEKGSLGQISAHGVSSKTGAERGVSYGRCLPANR
ncbi:hypothetical protein BC939DRAFT_524869 [Gamsiella multidivaricata]|uniref:uncharacterized protein n=1 Tax=Gamsiella multidivaricata TaxID=101098 RepID=UPI00221E649E|nr:uncharacterized protein BC939DRAFT_524869 [Gamsiella multidivaricata]KAG0365578.1 hypothetical protein BGZ54_006389 [Gamsiella multidivaricata]KAI7831750.1 hypothetical protein BC939DRAFT_524869 [Gamsiella multidivaricata]